MSARHSLAQNSNGANPTGLSRLRRFGRHILHGTKKTEQCLLAAGAGVGRGPHYEIVSAVDFSILPPSWEYSWEHIGLLFIKMRFLETSLLCREHLQLSNRIMADREDLKRCFTCPLSRAQPQRARERGYPRGHSQIEQLQFAPISACSAACSAACIPERNLCALVRVPHCG